MVVTTTDSVAILQRLQAIAEETRFRIIRFVAGGERCVCELQDELDAAQRGLSFQLMKLTAAGLFVGCSLRLPVETDPGGEVWP